MAEEMVYVYKLLDYRVEEHTGKFIKPGGGRYGSVEVKLDNGSVKRFPVHPREGKIFANTIWFKESDICRAIDVFVDSIIEEMRDSLLKSRVLIDNVYGLLIQKSNESNYSR